MTTDQKDDLKAIEIKLAETQTSIIKLENVIKFAKACRRITKSDHYKKVYNDRINGSTKELNDLYNSRITFQTGFNYQLNKY